MRPTASFRPVSVSNTALASTNRCRVIGPALRLDAGLRLAEFEALDAAVLDVNLNGTYVWPLAEKLHSRRVPYLLLTGFGAALDVPTAARSAPRMEKPIREGMLGQTLTRLLTSA